MQHSSVDIDIYDCYLNTVWKCIDSSTEVDIYVDICIFIFIVCFIIYFSELNNY